MKQQDVAIIIILVFFAGILSYFVSAKYITPSSDKVTVETVSAIDASFPVPDDSIFNDSAVNPSVRIEIAPVENPQPFTNVTN